VCSGLPTYCDGAIADETTINFNAGDRAISRRDGRDRLPGGGTATLGRFARE